MDKHPKTFVRNWKNDLAERFAKAEREYALAFDRGTPREDALRAILEEFLPRRYGVTTGHVVSAKPAWSRQCDVIIYDALECPMLSATGGIQGRVVPVEAVLGTIEIKSTLTLPEFQDALEKATAFKALCVDDGPLPLGDRFAAAFFYRLPPNLSTPDERERLLDACAAVTAPINGRHALDFAFVLQGANPDATYLLDHVPVAPSGTHPTSLVGLPRETKWRNFRDSGVPLFLLRLLKYLRNVRTGTPELFDYLLEDGVDVFKDPEQHPDRELVERGRGFMPIREDAIRALHKVTKGRACPSCDERELFVDDALYAVVARKDYLFGRQGRPLLPAVVVVCTACGLVMFHSSNVLGLTKFLEE